MFFSSFFFSGYIPKTDNEKAKREVEENKDMLCPAGGFFSFFFSV